MQQQVCKKKQVCKKTSLQKNKSAKKNKSAYSKDATTSLQKKNKSAKSLHIQKMIKDFVFDKSSQKSIQVCIFQYNNISIFGNKWVMPKALLNQNDYYIWDFYITQHKNITTYL